MTVNFWGNLLETLRLERGLSQRVLAHEAKVNRATLRKIESGETSADVKTLEKILDYFGYELEALTRESIEERQAREDATASSEEEKSRIAMRRVLEWNSGLSGQNN